MSAKVPVAFEALSEMLRALGDRRPQSEILADFKAFAAEQLRFRACPSHYFTLLAQPAVKGSAPKRYLCTRCKIASDTDYVTAYLSGAKSVGGNLGLIAAEDARRTCGFE